YCSEESGVVPDEIARETAYEKLLADLLEGDFEENGRSQVLYLHPYTTKARMTREWLIRLLESKEPTGPQSFRITSRFAGCGECFLSVGLPNAACKQAHRGSTPSCQSHLRQEGNPSPTGAKASCLQSLLRARNMA